MNQLRIFQTRKYLMQKNVYFCNFGISYNIERPMSRSITLNALCVFEVYVKLTTLFITFMDIC